MKIETSKWTIVLALTINSKKKWAKTRGSCRVRLYVNPMIKNKKSRRINNTTGRAVDINRPL